jgi:hypothetical protein
MRQGDPRTEAVAVKVFEAAQQRNQSVSAALVRDVLTDLADHPEGCCAACRAAPHVRVDRVLLLARQWETGTASARRLARR